MIYKCPRRYESANLRTSKFAPEMKDAVEYLRNFKKQTNNLIITGGTGCGKTYLIYAFINRLWEVLGSDMYDKDTRCVQGIYYFGLKNIIDSIRKDWRNPPREDEWFLDWLKTVPFLIIDEIGVNYGTESERVELYELFNYRWENMLPTVCVSNFNRDELESMLGLRIADRIYDNALICECAGASRRGK